MKTQLFARVVATFTAAGATYFLDPVDSVPRRRTTNEDRAQVRIPWAGKIRNITAQISANARTSDTTLKTRINGVDGLCQVVIPAGTTGIFTDTVNEDAVAAGDMFCLALAMGSGSATLNVSAVQVEFEADDGTTRYLYCYVGLESSVFSSSGPRYSPIGGYGRTVIDGWRGDNTVVSRTYMAAAAVVSHMRCVITANTTDGDGTFELYKNGAPTGISVTVPAGATGEFRDDVNTVNVAPDDYLQWFYTNPSRTTGAMALGHFEIGFQDTGDSQWQATVTATENANPLLDPSETPRYCFAAGGGLFYDTAVLSRGLLAQEDMQAVRVAVNSGPNFNAGDVTLFVGGAGTSLTVPVTGANSFSSATGAENIAAGDTLTHRMTLTSGSNSSLANSITTAYGPASTDVVGSGDVGTVTLSAPAGSGDTAVTGSGPVGTVTLSPPEGGAVSDVVGSGPVGTITLFPPRVTTPRATQAGMNVAAVASNELNATQAGLEVAAKVDANARVTQMGLLVIAKGGDTPLVPDPLSLQDGGREQLLTQRLVNMYVETTPQGPAQSARFQRPGLYTVAERGGGPIRATFLWNGFRITVSGDTVWRDAVNIGTVPAEGNLRWAISNDECVLVAGGRAYYVTLESVARIMDPDLPRVRDVVFLAGRFLYFDEDTGGIYRYSFLNDARRIDGLSFASAEANPDPILGAATSGEGVAMFGSLTTEWHFPTTDPDNPYQRSQGRTYDKGCPAIRTVVLADNSLHFVGHDRMVYRAAQVPQRVSNHDVEDRLRRQSEAEFRANSAFRIIFGGHTFYVLHIVGQGTWALDVGQRLWAEWKSWGMDRFRADVADDDGFMGDAMSGRILGFDGSKMVDFEEDPIERIVSTWQPLKSGTMRNFSLALHCQQGVGLIGDGYGSDPVVEMRFSDHLGKDWSPWLEGNLGKHGQRGKEALAQWTNLGIFGSPGRIFEFRCTDPVEFTPFMVSINETRP